MTATDQITCREPEDDSRDGLAIRALRRRRRAAAAVRRGARLTMTTRSARVAIALMALHVVDDSFLQPPPGTTFAGHLPSGLVPLAVLVALSWAFPRIRPGARAAVALVLGPFAIVLAAEAVHYWRTTGLSGDDWSGLLCIPAGLSLIGVAAALLWSSRRLDDSRWWRYPRRLMLGGAGVLGLAWIVFPLVLSYGVTHIARAEVPANSIEYKYESVTLRTADGLNLAGWYIPSRNGAAVIVYPGRGSAQQHARYLARQGYGVLMYDRRGEGASDGDPLGYGWSSDEDIRAGVAFLQERADVEDGRIGGLGLSVGGEMMLQTAADTPDLAAVVSDGAGARVLSEELADLSGAEPLYGAPMLAVKTAAVALFSNHTPPSNLTRYIARIAPRPLMLIHAAEGEIDDKTPEYLAAARGPAEEWEVPEGGHTAGIDTMPEEYARRVVGFFNRSLGLPARD